MKIEKAKKVELFSSSIFFFPGAFAQDEHVELDGVIG